jgi:hypothetical protein
MRRLASSAIRLPLKPQGWPTCANCPDIVNFMNFTPAKGRFDAASTA